MATVLWLWPALQGQHTLQLDLLYSVTKHRNLLLNPRLDPWLRCGGSVLVSAWVHVSVVPSACRRSTWAGCVSGRKGLSVGTAFRISALRSGPATALPAGWETTASAASAVPTSRGRSVTQTGRRSSTAAVGRVWSARGRRRGGGTAGLTPSPRACAGTRAKCVDRTGGPTLTSAGWRRPPVVARQLWGPSELDPVALVSASPWKIPLSKWNVVDLLQQWP